MVPTENGWKRWHTAGARTLAFHGSSPLKTASCCFLPLGWQQHFPGTMSSPTQLFLQGTQGTPDGEALPQVPKWAQTAPGELILCRNVMQRHLKRVVLSSEITVSSSGRMVATSSGGFVSTSGMMEVTSPRSSDALSPKYGNPFDRGPYGSLRNNCAGDVMVFGKCCHHSEGRKQHDAVFSGHRDMDVECPRPRRYLPSVPIFLRTIHRRSSFGESHRAPGRRETTRGRGEMARFNPLWYTSVRVWKAGKR